MVLLFDDILQILVDLFVVKLVVKLLPLFVEFMILVLNVVIELLENPSHITVTKFIRLLSRWFVQIARLCYIIHWISLLIYIEQNNTLDHFTKWLILYSIIRIQKHARNERHKWWNIIAISIDLYNFKCW